MQEAGRHINALQYAAREELGGFRYLSNGKYITNGHFVFKLGRHARGMTLQVFMVDVLPESDHALYTFRENDALKVYDAISGQLGWNETYGFVVDGVIKDKLQALFDLSKKTLPRIPR